MVHYTTYRTITWMLLVCLHLLLFHFSSSHSLCHPHDSFALLQFNTSFTIDTTFYSSEYDCPGGGGYPKTATWENGTDCCSWLGVTCHPISGHVTGLDLSCSGLQGKIHPNSTLFHLSHLQLLSLASNNFFQSLISSHFGGLISLTHLDLSHSNFFGEIPSQISCLSKLTLLDLSLNVNLKWIEPTLTRFVQNTPVLRELVFDGLNMSSINMRAFDNLSSSLVTLSLHDTLLRGINLTNDILCLRNLQRLDLSSNFYLEGQLPNLSCRATSLSILDLSNCKLQGSIPPSFSNLTLLTSLDLSYNNLNGSIPHSISNLTHLTSLDLSWNNLDGSIPTSLLTLPQLNFLHLHHNHLIGQIPNVFSQSSRFQDLSLSDNNIGGELPLSLSNLQHLILLDLSGNKFSSEIPNVFGGLTKLETLNLGNNNLEGHIPSSLFDLTHLSELVCSHNKLEGPLPNKITGFPNITELSLDNNLLNGTIPSWCLSLPSLVILDLSSNQFEGNIPDSIFNLVTLTRLDLSSNRLNGPVNFSLFSNLQNLQFLSLSDNSQLSLDFQSSVNYSYSGLMFLELSSLGLTQFPKISGKFPRLGSLDLSNNKLHGRVPNWLHEMDSLFYLNLSQNLLTPSMDQFAKSHMLGYLDLSFNSLAGGISSSICNVSLLQILNLSHNKLTGTIPQCITNLPYLTVLDLQMNNLHGTLPNTFSENNKLKTVNLYGNQLEGLLPKSLSNCTSLEVLNLGKNQLEDIFPHWVQTLPSLKVLVLRANKLHGPITNFETKNLFPSLIIFDISCNNFNGSIPKAYIKGFEGMKNIAQDAGWSQYIQTGVFMGIYTDSVTLTIKEISMTLYKVPKVFVNIDLSKNKFEGEIPNVIGELHVLKGLNLSHNRLSGPIPKSMANLANLESLDLSSNMLTGRIPMELTNLNYLAILNLSQNRLVGEIPQGKQFNTFLNDSYKGNLGLCGLPLSIKCSNGPEQPSPPSSTFQHDNKFEFGWKPVAIGYGCGFAFGVGIGCWVLLIGKPQWLVRMVGGQPKKRVTRRTN